MFPILGYTRGFCGRIEEPAAKDILYPIRLNQGAQIYRAAIAFDAIVSIVSFIIGVLGVLSVIHGMPPTLSYSLIGLSGVISALWIVATIHSKGGALRHAYWLIGTAVTCEPNEWLEAHISSN